MGVGRTSGYYGRYNRAQVSGGGEQKFFDTALSFTVDRTAEVPATGQLNLVPQGVEESQRIGRKITIKSIQLRGALRYAPGAGGTGGTSVTWYVVQDTQCNGAAAAILDVLTTNAMETGMINMANSTRFRILKKFTWNFQASAGVSAAFGTSVKTVQMYKKCDIPVEFSSTTGAITEIRSNNIFLLAGNESANDDDLVTMTGTCRIRYSD